MICKWFSLKPTRTIFSGLTSKSVAQVSQFGPQNWQLRFGDLSLKITMTVFDFDLKTKQVSVYRLRHKTDRGRTAQDTRRDLTTCLSKPR
jgi:hypothetical protein